MVFYEYSIITHNITIGLTVHSSYFDNRTVIYVKFIALLSNLDSKAKPSFFPCGPLVFLYILQDFPLLHYFRYDQLFL